MSVRGDSKHMEEIKMHPMSKAMIEQADSIPGFSAATLLQDMLSTTFCPISYAEAAKIASCTRNYISIMAMHGELKKYGKGKMVRVNKFEVINWFLKEK